MFASLTQKIVTVPGEPPATVTVRKLTGCEYEAAQFEHMTGLATGRGRNWANRFLALARAGTAKEADAQRVISDPLSGFDRVTMCKAGVVAWDCTEQNGKGETVPKPVTAKAIDDLDDEALELLASEILQLTKPALFQTPEEAQAEQKNG